MPESAYDYFCWNLKYQSCREEKHPAESQGAGGLPFFAGALIWFLQEEFLLLSL
jgi:hypothetical protein